MRWLIESALRLRVAIVALTIIAMAVGMRIVRDAPLDVFPEFAPPLVEVQTEAPGLSTEEVEALVTMPVEQALDRHTVRRDAALQVGARAVERGPHLRATAPISCAHGSSCGERLARLQGTLPGVARPPVLLSPLSSTSRVLKVGLSSKTLSQTELTTLVRFTVRPRLMSVPGVARPNRAEPAAAAIANLAVRAPEFFTLVVALTCCCPTGPGGGDCCRLARDPASSSCCGLCDLSLLYDVWLRGPLLLRARDGVPLSWCPSHPVPDGSLYVVGL